MSEKKKYFGTDGIRGRVGHSLINPDFMLKLGWAVGMVFGNGDGGKVLVGKDTRISGYMLESAIEAGLSAAGMDIHLLGPMPTPGIAYLTRALRAKLGIVISASHNPYYDNGIKFFAHDGMKLPDAVELAIEQQLEQPLKMVESGRLGKAARVKEAAGRYIEFCKSTIPFGMNMQGLKIVLDCAYGAAYHVAPCVFTELGAKVIALGVEPNGLNINDRSGATAPQILQKTVVAEGADIGIALDGDGDRLVLADHHGEVLDGDEILFILARDYHQRQCLNGGVVGTVMSNYGLEQALRELNIPFKRAAVGDRYVLEELIRANWLLGGEPSGHLVHLGMTTTGDGIISALQILRIMNEQNISLHELKAGVKKLPQTLINVPLQTAVDVQNNVALQAAILAAQKQLSQRGRILLRASGTESVIRVMVEGEDLNQVNMLAESLANTVRSCL